MIVHEFLRWVQTAPVSERADATTALARAYIHSPLSPADRSASEAAMTVLLDDPSPLVREALARALGGSAQAPRHIIHALAQDHPDVAVIVLAQSPILSDSELIEAIAGDDWRVQIAVACRTRISPGLVGAIAEVGGADACRALLGNSDVLASPRVLMRIVERHGHDALVRAALLSRPDLPADVRQAVVASLSAALSGFVADRGWMPPERATRIANDARDKGTVVIATRGADVERHRLVKHLRATGQLTVSLILRALLSGDISLFEETLTELSGLPVARVSALVASRHAAGFEALYAKAGLPLKALPAFRAALDALHEHGFVQSRAGEARLSRRMTERVLTTVDALGDQDLSQLLLLLRRFLMEAARDEARAIAGDIVKDVMLAA